MSKVLAPMNTRECFARLGFQDADFTAGEREAILAKSAELYADGREQDAAVAMAIKECAPTKAQAKSSIGGNYEWSRNSDGSYNIFDVPVFAKHVRKLGMRLVADAEGNPKVEEVTINVDEKWLNKAIQINRRRYEQEQYLGPLHVRHHPKGDDVPDTTEPGGHFLLKYVKTVPFEGESVPMLFTDWLRIPEAIFKRIQAGLLPYRSIESLPPHFEEIDSIALLETDVPWFRLPLTSVGKEIQREVYMAKDPSSPFRGFARSGVRWSALFYQAGEGFKEKDKATGGDDKERPAAGKDKEMGSKDRMASEAGEDDEQDIQADEPGDTSGGNTMGKILEALTALAKTNEMILAKLGGAAEPPTPQPAGAPAIEQNTNQSSSARNTPGLANAAAFDAARVAALETVVYGMQADKELIAKVEKALGALAQYNLPSDTREKLLSMAKASKDADKVIETYVETIKMHAAPMPPPAWAADAGRRGAPIPPPGEKIDPALQAYFAESPERGARALAAWNAHAEALKLGVIPKTMSRADFVKFNMTKDYSALVTG